MKPSSAAAQCPVQTRILELGRRHRVCLVQNDLDRLAAAITRLADDEHEPDEVKMTLVRLGQANILTAFQCHELLLAWLTEKGATHGS